MKKMIIIILLLFLLSANLIYSNNFEMYKWGMSKFAVKRIEGNNDIEKDEKDFLGYLRERYERRCLLIFQFKKNSLVSVSYLFLKKDMNYFLDILSKKYGEPKYDERKNRYSWVDDKNNFIGLMDMNDNTLVVIFPGTY